MVNRTLLLRVYYGAMVAVPLLLWALLWRDGVRLAQAVTVAANCLYWLSGETFFRTARGGEMTAQEFRGARDVNTSRAIGIAHAVAYVGAPLVALLLGPHGSAGCPVCALVIGALALAGLLLRRWAMNTLGQFFTRQLRVQEKQEVVSGGPYAYVRHPGYAANALLIIPYAVVACDNLLFSVPLAAIWLSVLYLRISVEEEMMLQSAELGEAYKRYRTSVKSRLIPGIF